MMLLYGATAMARTCSVSYISQAPDPDFDLRQTHIHVRYIRDEPVRTELEVDRPPRAGRAILEGRSSDSESAL
jgi:hypothetical protein